MIKRVDVRYVFSLAAATILTAAAAENGRSIDCRNIDPALSLYVEDSIATARQSSISSYVANEPTIRLGRHQESLVDEMMLKSASGSRMVEFANEAHFDGFTASSGTALADCGNYNGMGGFPDIGDLIYLTRYLYLDGAAPPGDGSGDLDDYSVVTNHDLLVFVRYLFAGGPPLTCPATQPRLYDLTIHDDSVYAHTYQSVFPYADILPPADSTYTITIRVTTDKSLEAVNLPISIRLGGDIPTIVSAKALTDEIPTMGRLNLAKVGPDSDKVVVASWGVFGNGYLSPGTYQVATVEIKVPPEVHQWRPITVALDSLPPSENGMYAHQPWAVGLDTPTTIYLPEIYYFPCLGQRRGNVNYDLLDGIDISDLTYMVGYMFKGGRPPTCFEEVDVTGNLSLDISDVTYLVSYMFKEGPPPELCP